MAGSVNKVILVGNLGKDPEVRTLQSGTKVVSFSVATSENWNDKVEQVASNPEFREQVEWELDAQDNADMVIFVFTKDSKAPITFLEFGLFAPHKDAVVCAEEGFYRQGNLDIVAERHKVPMYHNLDEMIADLQTVLSEKV